MKNDTKMKKGSPEAKAWGAKMKKARIKKSKSWLKW